MDDDLNNSFILELSGPGGDFDNPIVLNIANDFYTSLINGVLPNNLVPGEYKLRIRSTQPELVEETEFFTVVNSSINSTPSLSSNIESNSSYTQCLNDDVNVINPFFGSYNQNYNSLSGDMPSSNKFFTVTPTSDQSSIEVNIIDVSDGTSVTLSPISGTVYQIPENLSVGTYNIQVHETTTEGFSTFFSSAFIFHTSATIFGNASSETVCVGAEVTFNIDVGDLGIGSNSMGSYYIISFGDGSEDLILTQAQLLELYSDPISPITHIFEEASCTANGNSSFLVSFKLFNKGVDAQCDNYSQNGLGASKDIATAEAPDAQFELEAEQCINEDILVNNSTIPGSYPTPTGECAGDVNYDWQVKKPSFSDFLPVSLLNNSWVSGDNLIIPATDVDEIGCWEIKLIAVNPAACLSESQYIGIINIEDIPEANFSPVGDVCENDVINLIGESNIVPVSCDIELSNETPTYLWSIFPDSGYVLFNDSENNPTTLQSQNPIISFTEAGSYTLSLSVTTECGTDTHTETINVLGNPNVDIELDSMTFCSTSSLLIDFSDQLIPIYSDGFSAPSDYTWTVNGLDIDSDDYAFVNNTNSTDEFPTIQLNSFGTYNITVTAGSNCDTPASDTIIITLSQEPTITNTITSQDICSLEPSVQFDLTSDVDGTTYSWIAAENENLSGYEESGTTAFIPSQIITNLTNSDQDLVYTIIPIANGCAGSPFEYTLTVQPIPVVADKDETICNGETFTIQPTDNFPTEIVPIGTTYSWPAPLSNPTGVITGGTSASAQSLISQTLSNTSDYPATLTYSVTPNYNGCDGETFDIVITVNPTVGVDAIPDQVLCNGDNTLVVNFGTSIAEDIVQDSGEISYTWTNDNTDIGLAASGTGNITSFTTTNSTTAPITANITVSSVYTYNDISCEGESETFSITVNPSPQVNFSEDEQIVTSGDTTVPVSLSSPTNGVTFSWTAEAEDGITGLTTTSGSDTIPTETLFNATTEPQTVTYTAIATGDVGFDCEGLPTDYVVTVNPLAQVNPVEDQVVCNDENLLIEFTSNITGGTMTYSWTNDNIEIGLDAEGTGNLDFVATNNLQESITANIIVTPTFENGGNSNEGIPIDFSITVNPSAQVDSVGDIVVSNGTLIGPIDFTTLNAGGTTTYEWTNDNTAIGLSDAGTENISEFTGVNDGDVPINATIEVIPSFEENGINCSGDPINFIITINPDAQVNEIDDLVYNDGDLVQIPFSSSNSGGTTTYEWTSTDPSTGMESSGSGNIEFIATNTGNNPIVTTVTVIPSFENGGISNSGNPETFTVTVNPASQVELTQNINTCAGDEINDINFSTLNTGGTTTYAWTNDNTDIGLAASGNGDILSFTATNNTTSTLVATIEVTPTFENGGTSSTGNPETFTITVNPGAQVDSVSDQVLCVGELTNDILFTTTNTDGTTTYAWTNDNPDIGLAASGNGDILSFTAANNTTSALVATIEVTPTYENGGVTCAGNPETFTITVNPGAQVGSVADQVLCVGELTNDILFTTTNTDGTTTYEWTNDNTAIGLAANGVGDILSFVVAGSSSGSEIATIEVTPIYENGGVTCAGNPETFTITVNPGAQVDSVSDQVLCVGELTNDILFTTTNTDGTTTYAWTNDNPDIGLAASGNGDILSFTAANNTTSALVATIEVTPTYENGGVTCAGNPETFTITVLSEISITSFNITDAIDCNNPNSGIIDISVSGGSGVYDFLWSDGSTSQNLTGVPSGDYFVTITDDEGCIYTSNVFNVFRQQDLVVNLTTQISAVCETSLVTQQNNISISGGLPPYEINWSAGAVSLGDNTEMTAYEDGVYNVIVTDQYGCEVDTEIIVALDDLSTNGASFDYESIGTLNCGLGVLEEIEFTNTSDGDILGVTWDFGDGSPPVSGDTVIHQYTTVGEFEATITVQYNYGCVEVYTEEIEVADGFGIMLPTAFSPNNDGINDTIKPVYNCVNDINMSVYDTLGSLIYYENNINLQGWNGLLDGKQAENGNYLIVVNGTTIFGEEINLKGVFVLLR